ncbi:MAG TPA: FAD-binding oxidoreductase [Actinomycetota bacterium]|nr:FAD-binding oxidoreductase [Actinomycetota bacterium]
MVAHVATMDAVPAAALKAFGDRFGGRLFEPSSADYDEARTIWNGAIDRRPGLIARCADASDVVAAVRFALEHDLRTSVRSGGHGVGGLSLCDDGLVIDLSAMKGIRVDGDRREARVDAGVTLGELDRAAQTFGLAVPAGIVTHTGVAGLTLGGGIGWLTRKHGLTVDNLLEAEVVTADAELVRASDDENADLLWGLKGGGGNFGVVTAFRFRAHPIGPTVVAGPILFPLERTAEVMDVYRDWARDAPDELTTILNVRRAAASWVPDHLQGVPVCIVIPCWCGPIEEGLAFVEPIKRLGPILDLCEPRPWLEHQAMFDGSVVPGWHYYWKSVELDALSPDAVDAIVDRTEAITSARSYTITFQLGGAMARVGEAETGYGRRVAGFDVNVNAAWLPEERGDGPTHVRWVRSLFGDLEPMARGVYVNFLGEEGQDRVRSAYGPATYDRLAELKARTDPTNLFRFNQNVLPAS